jgi:ribonucleoside-diphosphate reductase alpha chain
MTTMRNPLTPKRVPSELVRNLRQRICFSEKGLQLSLCIEELEERLLRGVSVQFTPAEARDTVVLNAKSLLDLGPDFPRFSGRILLSYIYEETLPWRIEDGFAKLKQAHEVRFPQYIEEAVKLGRLDRDLLRFDLGRLASVIDPPADFQFDFPGLQTLYDRYLTHQFVDGRKRRLEAPQIFWMRVAMGLAGKEVDPQARCVEFYEIFRTRRACSSSPTLFNSGTAHPQLSSCYILYCGDSIEEIAETWSRFAHLSKWAGGLGCSWTAVRATGALIQGTNGQSSGVIPFLKVSNDMQEKRRRSTVRPGRVV